jgi:hypothetical protein
MKGKIVADCQDYRLLRRRKEEMSIEALRRRWHYRNGCEVVSWSDARFAE